ncbi:MAG: hypothetical protein D4R81_10890 [Nitrospiraceae bacterium]|nr:MAG: hypothetical protein D4R81_10890 [Nitrospiraceae bacterium]
MHELTELTAGAPSSARAVLEAAGLSAEKLRPLCKLRQFRSVLSLLLTVATFLGVPLLAWLFPHPAVYVLCVFLAIHNFNCFAQLVHASDHWTLSRSKRLNVLIGNLCAYPLGYNRSGHRNAHQDHHLYLNTESDPDLIWNPPDQTLRGLFSAFVQDLVLISAVKRFIQYFQNDRRSYTGTLWTNLNRKLFLNLIGTIWPVLVAQAVIFLIFAATAGPWFYLWLHVLPIVTLYPAQIRVRSMVEHGFAAEEGPINRDGVWVSRTTYPNFLERFILAPLGQNYHYEHHLFPSIPGYNLDKAHRLLVEAGIPVPISPGYVIFIFRKISAEMRVVGARY